MILGLHGKAGAGKDTFADHLVAAHGFVKRGFADPLYEEVATAFGVTVERLRDRTTKETMVDWLTLRTCNDPAFVETILASKEKELDTWMSPRYALQKWGTEYRRNGHDKTYWLRRMAHFVCGLPFGSNAVIPDCRFENEARWIVERGGHIIQILRPGAPEVNHHASEAGLESWLVSQVVFNTRDVHHLKVVADCAIAGYNRT